MPLSVLISNPERKKDRTDVGADDREVHVAGLSKFVTKGDLQKLFETVSCFPSARASFSSRCAVWTSEGGEDDAR